MKKEKLNLKFMQRKKKSWAKGNLSTDRSQERLLEAASTKTMLCVRGWDLSGRRQRIKHGVRRLCPGKHYKSLLKKREKKEAYHFDTGTLGRTQISTAKKTNKKQNRSSGCGFFSVLWKINFQGSVLSEWPGTSTDPKSQQEPWVLTPVLCSKHRFLTMDSNTNPVFNPEF